MKTFTLTLILLFSTITYAQQNEFIFHNLGSKHGLTYSAVRDIVQDNNGYIWIATLKGLNRYDGYNINQILAHRFINAHAGKREKETELLIMNY